jgi:hypothetical protein
LGETQLTGLTDHNKRAVFPAVEGVGVGQFVEVEVKDASQNTLFSELVGKNGVQQFFKTL